MPKSNLIIPLLLLVLLCGCNSSDENKYDRYDVSYLRAMEQKDNKLRTENKIRTEQEDNKLIYETRARYSGLNVKNNNGYDWKKASYQEKKEVCELLVNNTVRPLGENVIYWMSALNEFYDNSDDTGLRMTIWESALAMYYMNQ